MKSFTNFLLSTKSLILIAFLSLLLVGTFKTTLFILAPATYLLAIIIAYAIGGRINDHGINVAYNWSIKWLLFVTFLYLTGNYFKEAFVYAMFSFILINTVLNPTIFISKNGAST